MKNDKKKVFVNYRLKANLVSQQKHKIKVKFSK